MDSIPLYEILSINEMNEDPDLSRPIIRSSNTKSSASISFDRTNSASEVSASVRKDKNTVEYEAKKFTLKGHRQSIIQLKTVPEGFNLGRTYYLKSNLDACDQPIITKLSDEIIKAKLVSERKSKMKRSREMMQTMYESFFFQSTVAVLILLVRVLFLL